MTWEQIGRRATGAFYLFLLVVSFFIILPSLLDGLVLTDESRRDRWIFWLQTVSGNWAGTWSAVNSWWFAFSAVVAILLNNGLYLVVLTLVWQNMTDRKNRMTLGEALDAFEVAARAELIKRLVSIDDSPIDTVAKINEGLAVGRLAALPIIRAVGGSAAVAAFERAQKREMVD